MSVEIHTPKATAPASINSEAKPAVGRRVFIKTHGCQMNEYDSARMLDLLKDDEGAVLVDSAEQADVLLLNTCSIREKAQEKVFHQLGRWRSLKEKNPDLKIAVGGCVAAKKGQRSANAHPMSM